MKYNKLLINSSIYKEILDNDRLIVVDGGARGSIFQPFDQVKPDRLFVIKFEADPKANVVKNDNELIINKALWNIKEQITFYVADQPATSSIFPPNKDLLAPFSSKIGYEPRKTKSQLKVLSDTIDNICEEHQLPNPDFIKLDIHGSEYEALEGARRSLNEKTQGVLVETWTLPVHQGQKTSAQVDMLLNQFHFFAFNHQVLGGWERKYSNLVQSKEQCIAHETLYFSYEIKEKIKDKKQAMKYVALANLWGFNSYALELNNYFKEKGVFEIDLFDKIQAYILKQFPKTTWSKFRQKLAMKVVANLSKSLPEGRPT